MRRLNRRLPVKEPGGRPATPIEIEMIRAAVRLPISSSQWNRHQFISLLHNKLLAFATGRQPTFTITDAQVRFVARTMWKFRQHLPAELVVAAALKGGIHPSRFQQHSAATAGDRIESVEDPPEWSLPIPEPR